MVMSNLFGFLTDQLGGADDPLAMASYAQGTAAGSSAWGSSSAAGAGKHAGHPLLRRPKHYYALRQPGQIAGLHNQPVRSSTVAPHFSQGYS